MPALPSLGLNRFGSVRTAHPNTAVAPTANTTTKTPYWARTEADEQQQPLNTPVPRVVERKPVGGITSAGTTPSRKQSIARKPVAAAAAAEPGLVYTPVEGDPYRADPVQQWTNQVEPESHGSVPQAEAWPTENPLSPGSIFANGRPQAATASKSKGILSRGIGSIRKAAGQAKRSLPVSNQPKSLTPMAETLRHQNPDAHINMSTPLKLVDIEVAQANPQRYGRPLINDLPTAGIQADALTRSKGEPTSIQAFSKPAAAPVAPVVPADSATPKSKQQVSRMVVNSDDRETIFGDIIAAASDPAWTPEPRPQTKGQARGENEGKRKVSSSRAPSAMPASFNPIPSAGNPFTARSRSTRVPQPLHVTDHAVDINKSLPPSPAPGSLRCQTAAYNPVYASQQDTNRFSTTSLSEALEADGARRASYVPGIKCANCEKLIDAFQVADHRCGRRAAQAVDRESSASGPSREEIYAANYGMPSAGSPATAWGRDFLRSFCDLPGRDSGVADDEPEVIVDTFVRPGHTSWSGAVRSGVGSIVHSLRGIIVGGSDAIRHSNEVDAANGWDYKPGVS